MTRSGDGADERRGEVDPGLAVGRRVTSTRTAAASASTILARDGADGLEVFMLERHIETDFAGGALVFPGGKVDAADVELAPDRWTGIDPAAAQALVGAGSEAEAVGLYAAAVRETFEEAGVLLADRAGVPVTVADLTSGDFRAVRQRLTDRDDAFDWRPWLAEHDLVLRLDRLAFFSWWVTPDGVHRRYDTRFFVTQLPTEQEALLQHDDVETVASRWLRPADALAAGAAGRATVVFPTRKNLEQLEAYGTAAELVIAASEGRTDRRRLQPRIVEVEGRTMIQHPDGGAPEPG